MQFASGSRREMRDYKAKMEMYKLPDDVYEQLRSFCLDAPLSDRVYIEMALDEAIGDELSRYMYRHVVSTDYSFTQMELDGLPCGHDTFRIYRAKFYYSLYNILKRGGYFEDEMW